MHNNTNITTKNGQQLARPLKVLVPLIQRDIKNAEHAGKMFKVSAGGKLVEAKSQIQYGEWGKWLDNNFHLSSDMAKLWMEWWEAENVRGEEFPTASAFRRSQDSSYAKRRPIERAYHKPVEKILSGISQKEMRERAATAAREYVLERKLALQLIKIGYGVLATKLHPDKGGSHEAMRRLNKVAKSLRSVHNYNLG